MLPWNSFKKKQKLYFIKKGKRIFFPPILLIFFIPSAIDKLFVGISIPKKTLKKATQRNKIKRQIKESLRLILIKRGEKKPVGFFSFWCIKVPKR